MLLGALSWEERLRVVQGICVLASPIVTWLTLRWAWSFVVAERWRRQQRLRGFELESTGRDARLQR